MIAVAAMGLLLAGWADPVLGTPCFGACAALCAALLCGWPRRFSVLGVALAFVLGALPGWMYLESTRHGVWMDYELDARKRGATLVIVLLPALLSILNWGRVRNEPKNMLE